MQNTPTTATTPPDFDARTITRPHASLLTYYLIASLLSGPFFPLVIIPMLFRYHTLKYRFDDEGISMSWGVIFHQEIYLQYRRIQDIHVTRNVLHRWLGLASVAVQTASGNAAAEMNIEGIIHPEALRDYLYVQMRGARGEQVNLQQSPTGTEPTAPEDEALALLREIRDALRHRQAREEQ